ncbi:hypothetical protein PDESU_02873 [Pontiella desulfatans]|uniref:Uncharacterized protein n=1 Tax=Pontiella desulfatans TaxID=2750659 RepID=A0A6C2U3Y4_PONDE|nr:hypothetical protein [Pontiella desulfatans]VGO14314.1 hypothetical protein PDESU_02873 [Pontiella desulfatans]
MNKILKAAVLLIATALYLLTLRLFVSSDQPYYILGIGIVGLAAWFFGTVTGLVMAMLLVPLTDLVYGNHVIVRDFIKLASSPAYISMQVLAAIGMGFLRREKKALSKKETELEETNDRLQNVLAQVKEPGGIHSLCSTCKKIVDDGGEWQDVDHFLRQHTKMEFSHCICPDCADAFKKSAEALQP